MYTVKRFNAGDEISRVEIAAGTVISQAKSRCYGVIAPNGEISVTERLDGVKRQDIFNLKSAAQGQADWLNRQTA